MYSTVEVDYCVGQATEDEITAHFLCCDHEFVPSLSTRVDLHAYIKKIADRAETFEAWANGCLIGLVAAYCNNPNEYAFITSVSVMPDWQGKNIASRLMNNCMARLCILGFDRVELEVDVNNNNAISLYKKNGFTFSSLNDHTQRMAVNLIRKKT